MFEIQANDPKKPLINACVRGDFAIASELVLEREREINLRLQKSKLPLVGNFFDASPDKMMRAFLKEKNDDGYTALHAAVCSGNQVLVDYLLSKGAGVDEVNAQGYNSLHMAIKKQHNHLLPSLLGAGLDPNLPGEYGRTPLHFAAHSGDAISAYYLLKANCKVDLKTEEKHGDETALQMAVYQGHKEVVTVLMLNGADCRLRNKNQDTILRVALDGNRPEILEELLDGFLYLLPKNDFKEASKLLNELMNVAFKRKQIQMLKIFQKHPITSCLCTMLEEASFELKHFMRDESEVIVPSALNVVSLLSDISQSPQENLIAEPSTSTASTSLEVVAPSPPPLPANKTQPPLVTEENGSSQSIPSSEMVALTQAVVPPELHTSGGLLSEIRNNTLKLKSVEPVEAKKSGYEDFLKSAMSARRKAIEDKQKDFEDSIQQTVDSEWDDDVEYSKRNIGGLRP